MGDVFVFVIVLRRNASSTPSVMRCDLLTKKYAQSLAFASSQAAALNFSGLAVFKMLNF